MKEQAERNAKIVALREQGWTYKRIAARYRRTPERIRAIVKREREKGREE